jgi:flagellar biogenesis protein FliO
MNPLQVTFSLAGIVLIIIAAYYATWLVGVKASGQSRSKPGNKKINLIDRFAISKDKGFYLVEIAGKVYVVGITNQSMTLLDTLDSLTLTESEAEHGDAAVWRMAHGGRLTGRMIKMLAAFLKNVMGRKLDVGKDSKDMGGAGCAAFADSMRSARAKDTTGQISRAVNGEDNNEDSDKDSGEGFVNISDPAYIDSEG